MKSSLLSASVFLLVAASHFVGPSQGKSAGRQNLAFFALHDDSRDEAAVSVRQGDYACKFVYDAIPFSQSGIDVQAAPSEEENKKDAEVIMNRLNRRGECAKMFKSDFWMYTVCPGKDVKQERGKESYVLGKYHQLDGNVEKFNRGDKCLGLQPPKPREASVQFVCGKQFEVIEAQEVTTCMYSLKVSTPEACGVAGFKETSTRAGHTQGHVDRPWMLEIEEVGDGIVACSASVVDDLKVGGFSAGVDEEPLNVFRGFSLTVWRADEPLPADPSEQEPEVTGHSHSLPLRPVNHVVRGQNRTPFPPHELSVHIPGGSAIPVTLSTAERFPGRPLEYLQLTVSDPDAEEGGSLV